MCVYLHEYVYVRPGAQRDQKEMSHLLNPHSYPPVLRESRSCSTLLPSCSSLPVGLLPPSSLLQPSLGSGTVILFSSRFIFYIHEAAVN